MNLDRIQVEEELAKLAPAPLPESLLERFDRAMGAAVESVRGDDVGLERGRDEVKGDSGAEIPLFAAESELDAIEKGLRGMVPYGVPEDMLSRLDDAMSRWHEEVPLEEKVIAIHPEADNEASSWLGLRAVAAVGLLGAAAALFTGAGQPASMAESSERITVSPQDGAASAFFSPADARTSVISKNNHGVIWTANGQPIRYKDVFVTNRVQFANERGERLTVDEPKRELILTPVKFD